MSKFRLRLYLRLLKPLLKSPTTLYSCSSSCDWFTVNFFTDEGSCLFSLRYLPRMAVLDLQQDCHFPCLHLHLFGLSYNRMVCTESKFKMFLTSDSYSVLRI